VQAQTLTTLNMAREHGLTIIPVLSKIDSPLARIDDVRDEIVTLLNVAPEEVMLVSGKTGEGVAELLEAIIERIPAPKEEFPETKSTRALIFDFAYSNHRGVILYVRALDGTIKKGAEMKFLGAKEKFFVIETGYFAPDEVPQPELAHGEIGYIVTGIKRPGVAGVGDTVTLAKDPLPAVPGYAKPRPVVWASVFPESQDDLPMLRQALERDRLQVARDRIVDTTRRARLVLKHLDDEHALVAAERQLAGDEFVEHDAEAVDVTARIDVVPFAAGLLGRHVGRRAQHLAVARHGDLARVALGQAEIHDVRLTLQVEHDVRGLEVAMDHALPVRVI
jgi:translation elongation factor EF-G